MLDVMATLHRDAGLVADWSIQAPRPPEEPLWTVAVDIGGLARRAGATVEDYPLALVGACGTRRADTVVRAGGEAVERWALFPPEVPDLAHLGPARSVPGPALDFVAADLGVDDGRDIGWYRGTDLATGRRELVPAGLVDYPAGDRRFDPSPSGAAAGPSWSFAALAGLLEAVERDAVSMLWYRDLPFAVLDPRAVAAGQDPDARTLGELLDRAGPGVDLTVVDVPVDLAGIRCTMAVVREITPDGPIVATGVKAHARRSRSTLIAVQEALQVRSALRSTRPFIADRVLTGIRDDVDRAAFWSSPEGWAVMDRRLARAVDGEPPAPDDAPTDVEPLLRHVVEGLTGLGARAVAVDLSGRLPEPIRAMGWTVAATVVPGLLPLRMDETATTGWVPARSGIVVPPRDPHPLI